MNAFGLGACTFSSNDQPSQNLADPSGEHEAGSVDPCASPNQGCACEPEGKALSCGDVQRRSGDYVSCSMGKRICNKGVWGACVGDGVAPKTIKAPSHNPGVTWQGLGGPSGCVQNPCDPYCMNYVDTPAGLDAGVDSGLTVDGGLALTGKPVTTQSNCTGLQITPSTQAITVTDVGGGSDQGLTGDYFKNMTLSGNPVTSRTDSTVDFDWSSAPPSTALGLTQYSARWTGKVLIPSTDSYTFETESDDGARLWVNNQLLVDAWYDQSATLHTGVINLTGGQKYDVKMEYYQNGGGAVARLRWSSPSISKTIIPTSQLFPPNYTYTPTATDPSSVTFVPQLVPAGCYNGPLPVLWTLDKVDQATITNQGVLTVVSPIAGPIHINAYAGSWQTGAVANVVTAVQKTNGVSATNAMRFDLESSNPDPRHILYPYENTVFPLGLQSPLIQWESSGSADDMVRVSLRYPIAGAPIFRWSNTLPGSDPPRVTIPQDVWNAFSLVAKGGQGEIKIQRTSGGGAITQMIRIVRFATQALRGKIYYTEYAPNGWTASVKEIAPSGTAPAISPFGPSGAGCIPCHSVSANGKMFVTANWGDWNASIASINTDGSFNRIAYAPNSTTGTDSRGFAYSAISPDGSYVLQGANWWGNTLDYWQNSSNALDRGTGAPFTVWKLSSVPGTSPIDVSNQSANTWGLGATAMMVPAFSPDSKKLIFIDGDRTGGAAWRQGLSTWDFDQTGKQFSNRRNVVNTIPIAEFIRWPTFESDSHSVIYQTNPVPADDRSYGGMLPSGYESIAGQLWSVDSAASAQHLSVSLDQLNAGLGGTDSNRSFQPTMLPASAGGYRWAVFTSGRIYGNTLNLSGTRASQLWVSAIDDTPSAMVDRSHPPFWLPNQTLGDNGSNRFLNERGFWVLDPCKTAGNSCEANDECCGAVNNPPTGACRIDIPLSSPPTRHCAAINASACAAQGQSCGVNSDCCGFPTMICAAGSCKAPPPVYVYGQSQFVRDYEGTCPTGTHVVWHFLDWQTTTPSDSKILFNAQTADTQAALASASSVLVGSAQGAPITMWTGADVGAVLASAQPAQVSKLYLRVTAVLKASTDTYYSPVLNDWRQSFSCVPSE